ncbi:ABC transporter permease [Irregularibacter muris]|uniref:ABC transporter permease n=1 Tax=Irregularibacter muris TaxID=1796619 RepID=A0AAE3HIM9_9FIRM|nr:ABC transporter permease [Irregularibacter muris]MCR1899863.1 ABC transporter permease [Irregularibacter muris]
MNKMFYAKLAIMNIKKNAKTYIPYILTCIGTVMMYYIMYALSTNDALNKISGGDTLKQLLSLGTFVIALFAVIFLFYTNSFLIKGRKKEFGLFNILGMEKRHISRIMFFETLYVALISLIFGMLGGILLSKLMHLLLLKLLHFEVQMGFEISLPAILATIILFAIIFTLILFNSLRQIHLAKPIELLSGGQVGEKEPKTKWLLVIIGLLCLGAGYYIALTTESPIDAIMLFFVAVILVIIGTYCLFTAGSIMFLKMLRKNKKYYYKTSHFISVSGMIYRMKQNAVGLASICILATAVLVMVSTTVSLYVGMEDVLRTRYPQNIILSARGVSEEQVEQLDGIIKSETTKLNLAPRENIRYRSMEFAVIREGANFSGQQDEAYNIGSASDIALTTFIPLEEYNQMKGQSVKLASNEVLVYSVGEDVLKDRVQFGDTQFKIKSRMDSLNIDGQMSAIMANSYFFIVPDVETIENVYHSLTGNTDDMGELSYYYGFDVNGKGEDQIALTNAISTALKETKINGYVEGTEIARESFYSLYGGLFFLGIFLGLLFIMATVLIIYYKQISEGYDDKGRFEIMQKVGMSHGEVKKSIHSQVLTVFFLPLVAAGVHIAFAFKFITKLLALLNLTNVTLFIWCLIGSVLGFAVFYAMIYALTARVYYKIVSS